MRRSLSVWCRISGRHLVQARVGTWVDLGWLLVRVRSSADFPVPDFSLDIPHGSLEQISLESVQT